MNETDDYTLSLRKKYEAKMEAERKCIGTRDDYTTQMRLKYEERLKHVEEIPKLKITKREIDMSTFDPFKKREQPIKAFVYDTTN